MPDLAPPPKSSATDGPSFGNTPVTGATANRGFEAAALQKVGLIVGELARVLADVGATTEIGKTIASVLPKLSKLVPSGATSPAGARNQLQEMMTKNQQRNAQFQQFRQNSQKPPAASPSMPQMPAGAAPPGAA